MDSFLDCVFSYLFSIVLLNISVTIFKNCLFGCSGVVVFMGADLFRVDTFLTEHLLL